MARGIALSCAALLALPAAAAAEGGARVSLAKSTQRASVRAYPGYPKGEKLTELPDGQAVRITRERCHEGGYRLAHISYSEHGMPGEGWVVRYLLRPKISEEESCCNGHFYVQGHGCCEPGDPDCDSLPWSNSVASSGAQMTSDGGRSTASRAPSSSRSKLTRSQRKLLVCGLQYLGEQACSRMWAERYGTVTTSVSCSALIQVATGGRIDPASLLLGAAADIALDSDDGFLNAVGVAAKLMAFKMCIGP